MAVILVVILLFVQDLRGDPGDDLTVQDLRGCDPGGDLAVCSGSSW